MSKTETNNVNICFSHRNIIDLLLIVLPNTAPSTDSMTYWPFLAQKWACSRPTLSWHRSMMATTLPIKNCFLKNINFCWNPPQNLRQEPLKNEIYASFADSPIIIELICALTGLFSDHYFKMVLPLPCLKLFLGVKKRSPPLLLIFSVANSIQNW